MYLNKVIKEFYATKPVKYTTEIIYKDGTRNFNVYVTAFSFLVILYALGYQRPRCKYKVSTSSYQSSTHKDHSGSIRYQQDTSAEKKESNGPRAESFNYNTSCEQEGGEKDYLVVKGHVNVLASKEKGMRAICQSALSPSNSKEQSMKVLVWNCQGMGSSLTKFCLKDLYVHNRVSVICLLETKAVVSPSFDLRRLGFVNWEMVPPRGKSGGIFALLEGGCEPCRRIPSQKLCPLSLLISRSTDNRKSEGWNPPPQGRIKINCDASFCSNSGQSKVAAVARNEKGDYVVAMTSSLLAEKPIQSEGQACSLACILALKMGYQECLIETDCKKFVDNCMEGKKRIGHASTSFSFVNMLWKVA